MRAPRALLGATTTTTTTTTTAAATTTTKGNPVVATRTERPWRGPTGEDRGGPLLGPLVDESFPGGLARSMKAAGTDIQSQHAGIAIAAWACSVTMSLSDAERLHATNRSYNLSGNNCRSFASVSSNSVHKSCQSKWQRMVGNRAGSERQRPGTVKTVKRKRTKGDFQIFRDEVNAARTASGEKFSVCSTPAWTVARHGRQFLKRPPPRAATGFKSCCFLCAPAPEAEMVASHAGGPQRIQQAGRRAQEAGVGEEARGDGGGEGGGSREVWPFDWARPLPPATRAGLARSHPRVPQGAYRIM